MKKYEVELVNVNENNEITHSNSWGDESTFFDTIEEAKEEAQALSESWHVQQDWDCVLINEYNAKYDMWECVQETKIDKE